MLWWSCKPWRCWQRCQRRRRELCLAEGRHRGRQWCGRSGRRQRFWSERILMLKWRLWKVTHTPVAEEGGSVGGVSKHVEEAQDEEGEDVLDVVLVSSPHSLNILTQTLSSLTKQSFSKMPQTMLWVPCIPSHDPWYPRMRWTRH